MGYPIGTELERHLMKENRQMRDALLLAKMALEQGGSLESRITANGPRLGDIIEWALRAMAQRVPNV